MPLFHVQYSYKDLEGHEQFDDLEVVADNQSDVEDIALDRLSDILDHRITAVQIENIKGTEDKNG